MHGWECQLLLFVLAQDLGTCFGQDTRQMLLAGAPEDSITVTDITPDYWCELQAVRAWPLLTCIASRTLQLSKT